MAVKSEKELSESARSLWLKAMSAVELHNFGYAITLLQTVLKEEPAFLAGRQVLRMAEIQKNKGKKHLFGGMGAAGFKGKSTIKKDPVEAMDQAEKALENDPYNVAANLFLKEAALAASLPEVAIFALNTLADGHPEDTKILHQLGDLYAEQQMPEKAVEVYNRILHIDGADLEANRKSKDCSARASMQSEGWTEAASYRDLIKDKKGAMEREQQDRVYKPQEVIEQQLAKLHEEIERNPQNVDNARKIAALYEQSEEYGAAKDWYKYASELTGNTDTGLLRKVADTELKLLDRLVRQRQQELEQTPEDDPNHATLEAELSTLIHDRESIMIEEARKRVERNPTDLALRYELGEHLVRDSRFTEAIPELQKARNSPNTRIRACNLLGQCYEAKNMFDMAIGQYREVSEELTTMDATKKDVLYRLGLLYEKMNRKPEYLECLKQIYTVDYEYRDVANRVETSYSG
jgi:tetratricopeptide (TPR) repeat protein